MTHDLLLFDTYQQLIQTVVDLFSQNPAWNSDDARLIIKNKLSAAKDVCADYSATDLSMAEFSVCAFIDAYVLSQKYQEKHEWRKNLLQDEYFNTTDAGVIFFAHAEQLTVAQPDLLHLYFYCLASGFSGRYYALDARAALQKTMEDLLVKIDQTQQKDLLTHQGLLVGEAPVALGPKHKLSFYAWIFVPFLLVAAAFVYFHFKILYDVQTYLMVAS